MATWVLALLMSTTLTVFETIAVRYGGSDLFREAASPLDPRAGACRHASAEPAQRGGSHVMHSGRQGGALRNTRAWA